MNVMAAAVFKVSMSPARALLNQRLKPSKALESLRMQVRHPPFHSTRDSNDGDLQPKNSRLIDILKSENGSTEHKPSHDPFGNIFNSLSVGGAAYDGRKHLK